MKELKNNIYLPKGSKIAVALSGGVDSSVVTYMLKHFGYEVCAFTMVNFDDEEFGYCGANEGSKAAVKDAKLVCEQLGVEHVVIDVKKEFSEIVLHDFIEKYKTSSTPNPCTLCNPTIKWGAFFDKIKEHGYEYFATGHYVKLVNYDDLGNKLSRPHLYRVDNLKDQSYMLWALSKEQLSHTIFPLMNLEKDKVREIASENNLMVAEKKDSQEICFIKGHYTDFVNKIVPPKKGRIKMLATGENIGEHYGLTNYTIGQRKGLHTKLNVILYVHSMDVKRNILFVTDDKEDLKVNSFRINKINLLEDDKAKYLEAVVQIRYNSSPIKVKDITWLEDEAIIYTEVPVDAVTSGQSAVFYSQSNELLGGGEILI